MAIADLPCPDTVEASKEASSCHLPNLVMKVVPEKMFEAGRGVQMLMDVYGKLVKCDECLPVAANEVDSPFAQKEPPCIVSAACCLLPASNQDTLMQIGHNQPLIPYLACLSCKWWLGQAGSLTTSLPARRCLHG